MTAVATPILATSSADDEFKPKTLEEKAKREDYSASPEPRDERITVEKSRSSYGSFIKHFSIMVISMMMLAPSSAIYI
uniref:MFS transporter n=1 Tax=Steinernema glaseri TaxID=37863 RepID=A0A1I8A2H1_9BILA